MRTFGILLLFPLFAVAQLGPRTVTVTAARTVNPQRNQVVFGVTLSGGSGVSLDDALAAVSGAGLTLGNFVSLNSSSGSGFVVRPAWSFTVTVPIDQVTQTSALLSALQQNLAKEKTFALQFSVNGAVASAAAQQAQDCPLADLIGEARSDAANLASAAGATAGAIQALAGSVNGCSITASFALGGSQTEPDAITIAATQAPAPAGQQFWVVLNVSADPGTGLEQVLQAVAPAGVSEKNLVNAGQVITGNFCPTPGSGCVPPTNPIMWAFQYTVGPSKLKEAVAALSRLQTAPNSGISIAYSVSASTLTQQCAVPTLVSQARKQAANIAAAAGLQVGPVVGLSKSEFSVQANVIPTVAVLTGNPAWFTTQVPIPALGGACTAVVRFQLAVK